MYVLHACFYCSRSADTRAMRCAEMSSHFPTYASKFTGCDHKEWSGGRRADVYAYEL